MGTLGVSDKSLSQEECSKSGASPSYRVKRDREIQMVDLCTFRNIVMPLGNHKARHASSLNRPPGCSANVHSLPLAVQSFQLTVSVGGWGAPGAQDPKGLLHRPFIRQASKGHTQEPQLSGQIFLRSLSSKSILSTAEQTPFKIQDPAKYRPGVELLHAV